MRQVVDFGSSLFANAWHPPLVGTMHYRAPEAVLQVPDPHDFYSFTLAP